MTIFNIPSVPKMVALARDVAITVVNLPTAPLVLGIIPPLFKDNSEINLKSYDSGTQYFEVLYEALRLPGLPEADRYYAPESVGEDNYRNEKWYFLNGICTNEDMWELNAEALYELFGRKIHPLHNRSSGALVDLWESIKGRTFDKPSDPALQFAEQLIDDLQKESLEKVVIIAHSQGGIIAANILKYLAATGDEELLSAMMTKLELYTFASASDEVPDYVHRVEHFANRWDFFTRIGAIVFTKRHKGQHFRTNATGHLLNIHYLPDFKDGKYTDIASESCAKCSRLFQYIPQAAK